MRRVLIAIVLCAAAAPAAAQPSPWEPGRTTAGWVFTPAITFGGMWDSNVTLRNESNPQTSELVGILSPRGSIDFNGRRAHFSAGYSGTLEAYNEISELTRYDQRGRVDARYQMTPRLSFNTRETATFTPTTDQLELGGVPFTQVGSRMVDAFGGFSYDLTTRSKLIADYNFQWVDFDRDAAETSPDFARLQGGHSNSPTAEYRYQVSRRLDVGGVWAYRRTNIDGGEEIFDSQDVRGLVQFAVGPATSIRGSAGFAHAVERNTNATQSGPSYAAGIEYTAGRTLFEASYERSFLPSFGFGTLSASQVFRTAVSSPIARGRMFAGSSFSWRRTEPAVERGSNITLNSYWWNSTFGFHATRWLRTEAFVSISHQASDAQGNFNRNRVGVQFVTHKPMRIQ